MPPAQHTPRGLAGIAARGGLVSALGTWGRFVLQFGTVVVVARLLGPAEYGFAAVLLVLSSISELLRGSGLATAVLQRSDLTPAISSRVHYLSCALGAVLGCSLLLASAPLAQVLHDARVITFAPLLALILLCAGASAVPSAMLARELAFGRLAAIDLTAAITGCATALALATAGFGAAALVWQATAVAVLTCIAVSVCGPFRPGRPATRRKTAPYVGVGLNMAVTQLVRYAAQNLDRVLLAAQASASSVGVYAQAMQLIQLPIVQLSAPLQRVVVPVLSRQLAEPDEYRRTFRGILQIFTLLLWPALVVLAVLAPKAVLFLFGEAWLGSAELMRFLLGTGFAAPLVFATSWAFVSMGRTRSQALLMIVVAATTVGAIALALPFGAPGVALAVSAASVASLAPSFALAVRCSPIRVADLFMPLRWPLVLAVLAGLASWAGSAWTPEPLLGLLAGSGAALAALTTTCLAVPDLRRFSSLVRTLIRRGDTPTPPLTTKATAS